MDIRTLLQETARVLAGIGSPTPRLDAEVLLMHFLGTDRLRLFAHPERTVSVEEADGFSRWVERRRGGEPVSYIVGEKEFWSLRFEVGRGVLIPRPETECLIEEALGSRSPDAGNLRIIDIGTGSGAIGVALARELPDAVVVATDISPAALSLARRNARAHGVEGRMAFLQGDLFAGAAGPFDWIVSNPPYIAEGDYPSLPRGIREFEPREALIAGPDGTAFHRRIVREGAARLKPGGWIFLEIGEGQTEALDALFRDEGLYEEIRFRKDYGGMDRVVSARKRQGG